MHELLCGATLFGAACTGFLTKLGGEHKSWRRRFCVVPSAASTQLQLRYYADESLTHLHGAFEPNLPPTGPSHFHSYPHAQLSTHDSSGACMQARRPRPAPPSAERHPCALTR